MLSNKGDKSSRRKKNVKDISNTLDNVNNLKIEENSIEILEDPKSRSFLKTNSKKNGYVDEPECDNISLANISRYMMYPQHHDLASNNKTHGAKICSSCKNNVIKGNPNDIKVSTISNTPICCRKMCAKHGDSCSNNFSQKNVQRNNSSLLDDESKIPRLDLLLQFVDQMKHMVVTRELSFDTFRSISERLTKDKMNIELLLLTDVIIRAQVIQMIKLISKDLSQNNITPRVVIKVLLKQYQFLKSLSQMYRQMLVDYESTFLAANNLTFDLIGRAYFEMLLHDCPNIKNHIVPDHINIKIENLCDGCSDPEQLKDNYTNLMSDLKDSDKSKEIDKTICNILRGPDDIVKSLVGYFNRYFGSCFTRSSPCTKECCDTSSRSTTWKYLEILRTLPNLPTGDICSISRSCPHNCDQLVRSQNNNDYGLDMPTTKYYSHEASIGTSTTSKTIPREACENVKPPSISCSSSSNNSNGYNSCISISSYEESADDDDDVDDDKDKRFFQKWKRKFCSNEDSKSPSPISFNDDDRHDYSGNRRWAFHSPEDELSKFDEMSTTSSNLRMLKEAETEISDQISRNSFHDFKYSKSSVYDRDIGDDELMKGRDLEMCLKELLRTPGFNSSCLESPEKFEELLENETNPAVKEYVNAYLNRKLSGLDSPGRNRNVHPDESKQTVSEDESFDLPLDCSSTGHTEGDSNHEHCSNNNTSLNNNMSSSETGSSSASTENTSNNKVCNCCKCEMFGEQSYPGAFRTTNVVEKLRIKLQQRKQSQQKSQLSGVHVTNTASLPDVDTLVQFINGSDKNGDATPQTPDVARSFPKKNKSKNSKHKSKKTAKTADQKFAKTKSLVDKEFVCIIPEELLNSSRREEELLKSSSREEELRNSSRREEERLNSLRREEGARTNGPTYITTADSSDEVPEKDAYDPVVEDFKRFCSSVVVPQYRKKLPIDASVLIGAVQKRQMCVRVAPYNLGVCTP